MDSRLRGNDGLRVREYAIAPLRLGTEAEETRAVTILTPSTPPPAPVRLAALVLAALLAGCAGSDPAPPAPTLTGTYTNEHPISAFDGTDFVPETVTDRLAVIDRGDSLEVSFTLLHTNYHICEWHGTMAREDGRWVSREPMDYVDGTCTLGLDVAADTLTLRDEDWICRRAYCGARGVIDGTQFARSTRTPDTSWRDELR
ncbi:MAG: hypothetical protein AAF791_09930 [Bacteroidota bacterium]